MIISVSSSSSSSSIVIIIINIIIIIISIIIVTAMFIIRGLACGAVRGGSRCPPSAASAPERGPRSRQQIICFRCSKHDPFDLLTFLGVKVKFEVN